jgi:2-polyprenyl-3-methyl-5-hydroxy-6-metoxy-1,4-benzoquinol methylase
LDPQQERDVLERVAADSWYADRVNGAGARYCARVFARFWSGERALELGPAEGLLTETIAEHFDHLVLVDGSESFCRLLRERFPAAEVHCRLFEEFEPAARFDAVVLGHVLEHVAEPAGLLRRVKEWLEPEGRIFAAVPNARSLHRQAAVIMGLLGSEDEWSEADRHHGHRRIYEPETLRREFEAAALRVEVFGGYWLKPLSNAQIERDWSDEMIEAFMALGERYPEIAGEIYVVAAA